jgi:DNA transformation protein
MGDRRAHFAAFIIEQLHELGPLTADRFFGGFAIRSGSILFAMIMDGTLYFAVDDTLRDEYEKLGSRCFSYDSKKGRVDVRRFYEVPVDLLEEPARLAAFARRSVAAAATRAAGARSKAGKRSAKPRTRK